MLDGLRRACRSVQLAPHALEDELICFGIIDLMSSSLCHTVSNFVRIQHGVHRLTSVLASSPTRAMRAPSRVNMLNECSATYGPGFLPTMYCLSDLCGATKVSMSWFGSGPGDSPSESR